MNRPIAPPATAAPELVSPAGSQRAAQAALEAGADAIYLGLPNATNARRFAGLNLEASQIKHVIRMAHSLPRHRKVYLALNTFARADRPQDWWAAADLAADCGVDALIVADIAVMAYCRERHPDLRLHLSVQASATSHAALTFYQERYGIQRAVLPRVLTVQQVAQVCERAPVDIEVFGFGSLCVMVEGRCALSSYVTGESPNNAGVCSPASAVRWSDHHADGRVQARLQGVLIDDYQAHEARAYPTLCKGRFVVNDQRAYALESPTSLNTLAVLPELMRMGVKALKIEGRQRSAAYVSQVTQVWRDAIDRAARAPAHYTVDPSWAHALTRHAEGQQETLGAYSRPWR